MGGGQRRGGKYRARGEGVFVPWFSHLSQECDGPLFPPLPLLRRHAAGLTTRRRCAVCAATA